MSMDSSTPPPERPADTPATTAVCGMMSVVTPGTGTPTAGPAENNGPVRLRPLTARSAMLSLLLGAHPPSATVGDLVSFGRQVDIKESAVRAALTRMVGSGDLLRDNGTYTLPERLLERQRRQDEAMQVPDGPWDGGWRVAAVMSSGKDSTSRMHLRRSMLAAHFGELREGVWMRPANLSWRPGPDIAADLAVMSARPEQDPVPLAEQLFATTDWSAEGRGLLEHAARATSPRDRLTVFAAIVRHLTRDPLLPAELLPADWPGAALRETYGAFREEVIREWRSS